MQDGAFALWKLYVLPGHHGHGIGSRLLNAVVDRALELGLDRIVLSHIEGNRQAARFYAAHGFTETHRESGGSGLPVSVWMERRLHVAHADGSDAEDRMSGRPDAVQQDAARTLEEMKRVREIEEQILARAPENDVGPSLERITAVMELAGDPQRTYPTIHLTGTNGKTSTSRMIDAILRESGLSTGRFTSPHLHDIRERITLSGKPISREKFIAAFDEMAPLIDIVDARSLESGGRRMNFFEVLVALAYAAFADAPVDVAIIEVGLGGSWDATNVIDAQVAVVTPSTSTTRTCSATTSSPSPRRRVASSRPARSPSPGSRTTTSRGSCSTVSRRSAEAESSSRATTSAC